MVRAYRDAQQCIAGRADPSFFIERQALQFTMGSDGLVVDIDATAAMIFRRHHQNADDIATRHRMNAEALASLQVCADADSRAQSGAPRREDIRARARATGACPSTAVH